MQNQGYNCSVQRKDPQSGAHMDTHQRQEEKEAVFSRCHVAWT